MTPQEDSKLGRLLRWEAGETPGPWELVVFPTNRCNLQCQICWQRWAEQQFGKVDFTSEVPDDRLLALVDEAAEMGVHEWMIVGGGEPMVRGDLVMRMCKRIRECGMNGAIQTNGTRFTPDQLEDLVRIAWNQITVSLDGPNPEINDKIRSEDSFERATKNLRLLEEIKRKHGARHPTTSLNSVVTNLNYDKLDQMVMLGHELGCAGVGVSGLLVQGDACAAFALNERQQAELPKCLEKAGALARQLGIDDNYASLVVAEQPSPTARGSADAGTGSGLLNALCYEAWLSLAILAEEGKAGPCCVFWEKDVDTIRDKTLREVWLGPYMQTVRGQLSSRRQIPSYCKLCCTHIAGRTRELREGLISAHRPLMKDLGAFGTAGFMTRRLIHNLRARGLSETVKRGREWLQLRRSASRSPRR